MTDEMLEVLGNSPVIAAIKDGSGLEAALKSNCSMVFVLYGNICNIAQIAARIKNSGRYAFVHADLVAGLSAKEEAVEFLATTTCAQGVISTKPQLLHRAAELGMTTVQRFFLLDSLSLAGMKKHLAMFAPDIVEVLPAVQPKTLRRVCAATRLPVIAGGLIADKEDVLAALEAGATAISTTNQAVWDM